MIELNKKVLIILFNLVSFNWKKRKKYQISFNWISRIVLHYLLLFSTLKLRQILNSVVKFIIILIINNEIHYIIKIKKKFIKIH